jgi:hypothetical protein
MARDAHIELTLNVDKRQLRIFDSITVKGRQKLMAEINRVVRRTAEEVLEYTRVDMISGTKTGKLYVIYRNGGKKLHRASSIGETPAADTFKLVNSFKIHYNKRHGENSAHITNTIFYADILWSMGRPIILFSEQQKTRYKERIRQAVANHFKNYGYKRK